MAVAFFLLLISVLDSVKGSDLRFVAHGSHLQLDVKTAANGKDDFSWKFNESNYIVKFNSGKKPVAFGKYKGRADFFEQNYSLILRDVQHSDSGIYKAIESGSTDITLAEYTVRVQDPVSRVNLTLSDVDPSSCNLTATCKTVDSQISGTFRCQNTTCHLLDHTDWKESILNVYIENNLVTCNHSNNVSWEKNVKDAGFLCKKEAVPKSATIGIAAGAGSLVVLSLIFVVFQI